MSIFTTNKKNLVLIVISITLIGFGCSIIWVNYFRRTTYEKSTQTNIQVQDPRTSSLNK